MHSAEFSRHRLLPLLFAPLLFAPLLFSGCSTFTRGLVTAGGAAGGAGVGYALAGDNHQKRPLYMAGGAAVGALGTALFQGKDAKVLQEGYEKGYTQAASDAIKRHYWLRQALQKDETGGAGGQTYYYDLPAPESNTDGTQTVPHSVPISIVE